MNQVITMAEGPLDEADPSRVGALTECLEAFSWDCLLL
jgi:hypothetical protein